MLTESSTGLQHSSDNFGESIFSKMIKAGHRTYFLDVKETRNKDYFMTITELRKKTTDNGVENERNKVFLYQEDSDLSRRAEQLGDIVYHPDMVVTHAWARENTRTLRGNLRQVRSICQYFHKWGWKW